MENGQLLRLMQIFISVADSGSFSESARRLAVSQPSISRQISALEDYLGVRLIQRTTRRLSLTEAGQIYYEKARHIQHSVIEAGFSISGFKDRPSGTLKIGAPYTWTEAKITPYLGEFLHRYPDLKLDIECNDRFQDMIEDRLDVVIRVGVLKDSSYVAVPLGNVKMVMCATPNYLQKRGKPKTITDLHNHNWILFEEYKQLLITENNISQKIDIDGNLSSNTVPVMLAGVLQHMGVTVLPDLLIHPLLDSGELVELLPHTKVEVNNLPINQVFAMYSNRKHMPAKVRAFIDFFRDRFAVRNAD